MQPGQPEGSDSGSELRGLGFRYAGLTSMLEVPPSCVRGNGNHQGKPRMRKPRQPSDALMTPEDVDEVVITKNQGRYLSWVTDVLIDIVVLNFFVEYVDTVVIDSFSISVLAALLMKLMIDAVKGLEHRVAGYFRTKEGRASRILGLVSVFSILFLSKFVILEAVNLVFGDHVELGHFVEVAAIIVTMLLVRGVLQAVYRRLGARS